MRPLSAAEAISPAIERTRDFLSRPFRWQTFLKLAAVAFFAEMGGGSFKFNFPGRSGGLQNLAPGMVAFIVAFAVILGLIFFVIGLILFYIGSRLQLVLVELVATRRTWVSPVWRRVGPTTWRWIGLKLLYCLVAILLVLLLAIPIALYFGLHFHNLDTFFSGAFSGLHIFAIVLMILAAFVILMAFVAVYMLLRDLALPFLALENLSISEALRRLRLLLNAEPGQVALFLLLKLVLVFVFAIAGEICVFFVALVSLIPFGIVGGGLWLVLHKAGTAGIMLLVAAAIVGGLIFLCWMICVGIGILGSVYTFSQAYALYFLGGRYPLLGDLLDRSTLPPSYAVPQGFPSPPPNLPQTEPPPAAPTA